MSMRIISEVLRVVAIVSFVGIAAALVTREEFEAYVKSQEDANHEAQRAGNTAPNLPDFDPRMPDISMQDLLRGVSPGRLSGPHPGPPSQDSFVVDVPPGEIRDITQEDWYVDLDRPQEPIVRWNGPKPDAAPPTKESSRKQIDAFMDVFRELRTELSKSNREFIDHAISMRAYVAAALPAVNKQLEAAASAESTLHDGKGINVTSIVHHLDQISDGSNRTFQTAIAFHISQKALTDADLDKMEESLRAAGYDDVSKAKKVVDDIRKKVMEQTAAMRKNIESMGDGQKKALLTILYTLSENERNSKLLIANKQIEARVGSVSQDLEKQLKAALAKDQKRPKKTVDIPKAKTGRGGKYSATA